MRIYKKDNNTAVIKFYGAIDGWYNNAESFTNAFEDLDAQYPNIDIRVHCVGGSVMEGVTIYNCIKNAKAKVTVYIDGMSASMMTIVMLAADKIVMADNAYVMIHTPFGYTEGNAKAHLETAKLLEAMEANCAQRYSEKTGKSVEDVKEYFDGEDHWFSATEALAIGLVDEIAPAVVKNVKLINLEDEENRDEKIIYNRYAALLKTMPEATTTKDFLNINDSMKKLLISMFALALTEASSDEDVANAIKQQFDDLNKKVNEGVQASAKQLIANSEKARNKEYDETTKQAFMQIAEKAGIEALATSLSAHAPVENKSAAHTATPRVVNMLEIDGGKPDDGRKDWTWDDFQAKDVKALEKMEDEDPDRFKALYDSKYN